MGWDHSVFCAVVYLICSRAFRSRRGRSWFYSDAASSAECGIASLLVMSSLTLMRLLSHLAERGYVTMNETRLVIYLIPRFCPTLVLERLYASEISVLKLVGRRESY